LISLLLDALSTTPQITAHTATFGAILLLEAAAPAVVMAVPSAHLPLHVEHVDERLGAFGWARGWGVGLGGRVALQAAGVLLCILLLLLVLIIVSCRLQRSSQQPTRQLSPTHKRRPTNRQTAGLLQIIYLGESIIALGTHSLSADPPQPNTHSLEVLGVALGAVITWALFLSLYHVEADQHRHALRQGKLRGLLFHYLHFLLGCALNATGAGLLMGLETYKDGGNHAGAAGLTGQLEAAGGYYKPHVSVG